MTQKKAQIEVQFNWIFILIVGAIILVFFISLITTQKRASEASIAAEIMGKVDTIMTGAKVSIGTTNVIDIPRLHLEIDCAGYRVGTEYEIPRRNFIDKIVFSPDRLEGNQLITWTQQWDAPFRVSNFLYFTTPGVRYIFIYSDTDLTSGDPLNLRKQLIQDVENKFPALIEKDMIEVNSGLAKITDMNNYKVRLIFLESFRPTPSEIPNIDLVIRKISRTEPRDLTALWIDPENKVIEFYEKNATDDYFDLVGSTVYYDDSTLFGAMFSDRIDNYECSVRKALERFSYISQVYKKRTKRLADLNLADCETFYRSAVDSMDRAPGPASDFDNMDISQQNIPMIESTLQDSNYGTLRYSCPMIY